MNKVMRGILLGAMVSILAACSGGGTSATDGASSSNLTISGKLNAAANVQSKPVNAMADGKLAISLSDLELYATAYTKPPQIKTVDVRTDGSFSVAFDSITNATVSAVFRKKSDPTSEVGLVIFRDTTQKDFKDPSKAKESNVFSLKGNVQLGNITLSDDGRVTVDISTIAAAVDTSTGANSTFDFGGVWKTSAYAQKPTGYLTAGDSCGVDGNGDPEVCIEVGQDITLLRIVGKEFTPAAGCTSEANCAAGDGTIGTSDKYAVSIWEGDVANGGIKGCGYKTGFTPDAARFGGRIHIASAPSVGGQAIAMADYVFTSANDGNQGITGDHQPWMKTGSTSNWDMQDCRNITQSGMALSVCTGKATLNGTPNTSIYMTGLNTGNSGCIEDSTQQPVFIENWQSIVVDAGPTGCTHTDVAGFTGLTKSTCHYTNQPVSSGVNKTFSCTHTGGTFKAFNGSAVSQPVDFSTDTMSDWQTVTLIAQGQTCDIDYTGDEAKKMAAYRCYANNYRSDDAGACGREYQFNWAAPSSADFVIASSRPRPKSNFLTDIVTFSADGNTLLVDNSEHETISIPDQNGGLSFCDVERTTKVTGQKVSSTEMLFTVSESGRLMNYQNAACVAAANGSDTSETGNIAYKAKQSMKLIFTLTKQ